MIELTLEHLKGNAVQQLGRYRVNPELSYKTSYVESLKPERFIKNCGILTIDAFGCPKLVKAVTIVEDFYSTGRIESYQNTILIEQQGLSFAENIWSKVEKMMQEGRSESALVLLFDSLHENLNNASECNDFLVHSLNSTNMSVDMFVHILNALSPIRQQLHHWNDFKTYAETQMQKQVGEETTKLLLKVIV